MTYSELIEHIKVTIEDYETMRKDLSSFEDRQDKLDYLERNDAELGLCNYFNKTNKEVYEVFTDWYNLNHDTMYYWQTPIEAMNAGIPTAVEKRIELLNRYLEHL